MTPLAFLVAYVGDKLDWLDDDQAIGLLQATICLDLILAAFIGVNAQ
jgi:hypothetical protein